MTTPTENSEVVLDFDKLQHDLKMADVTNGRLVRRLEMIDKVLLAVDHDDLQLPEAIEQIKNALSVKLSVDQ